jgi:hypothetical protein
MVPLGSFAQSGTPAIPSTSKADELVTTEPVPESPEATAVPTPPVPLTPPSFGAGDKADKDDDEVEHEDDHDDEDEDEDDDDEDEGDDD